MQSSHPPPCHPRNGLYSTTLQDKNIFLAVLKHLHWLPVSARIHFKISLLAFRSLHTIAPSYLSSLIQPYVPLRALRSSLCPTCQYFSARVVSDRPVRQSGIPYHSQLRLAPPSTLSRNNLRCSCLPQPSPLVELSSMRL